MLKGIIIIIIQNEPSKIWLSKRLPMCRDCELILMHHFNQNVLSCLLHISLYLEFWISIAHITHASSKLMPIMDHIWIYILLNIVRASFDPYLYSQCYC